MGRGRSGNTFSSKRKCAQGNNQKNAFFIITNGYSYEEVCSLTREQIEALKNIPNEQLAAAILSPAAQPSTPREQTPASGHRAGSKPRASQAS